MLVPALLFAPLYAPLAVGTVQKSSLAQFDAPVTALDRTERFEAVLDADGDGDPDALSLFFTNTYYSQVRAEVFLDPWHSAPLVSEPSTTLNVPAIGGTASAIASAVADFDGDGDDDLVVTVFDELFVLRSESSAPGGTVRMFERFHADLAAPLQPPATGDFDGDGNQDFAVVRSSVAPQSWKLEVFRGAGDGTQFDHWVSLPLAEAPRGVASGQFVPGDSAGELILHSQANAWLVDFDAAGAQAPVPLPGAPLFDSFDTSLAAGDLDGDGDDDAVVFGNTGQVGVIRQTAPGTFVVEATAPGGPATGLADVDGDGDLDGVCCGGSGGPSGSANNGASNFEIAINDGTGRFEPAFQIPSLGSHHIAGALDVDGDGDVDLVGGRSIYYGRGPLDGPPGQPLALPTVNELATTRDLADVEHDGDLDLFGGIGTWSMNRGSNLFAARTSAPPTPPGLDWGGPGFAIDFDGDGDVDRVASLRGASSVEMRALENRGGALVDIGPAGAPGVDFNRGETVFGPLEPNKLDQPRYGAAFDVDLDGDLDLLTHRGYKRYGSDTAIWHNDGAGFFRAAPAGLGLIVHVADFDGDSLPDALLLGSNLSISYGLPGGAWSLPAALPSGWPEHGEDRVAVADLDADGDLDIAVVGNAGDDSGITWNEGGRSFSVTRFEDSLPELAFRRDLSSFDRRSRTAFAVELDGDAASELLVGPAYLRINTSGNKDVRDSHAALDILPDRTVRLLSLTQFDLGAAEDLDGDGDPELIGATRAEGLVRIGPLSGAKLQFGQAAPGGELVGGALISPVLGLAGEQRVGQTVQFRLCAVPTGALSFLAFNNTASGFPLQVLPGILQYVEPVGMSTAPVFAGLGQPGAPGDGGWNIDVFVDPALAGFELVVQALVADPSAPLGASSSNALFVRYGF